MALEVKDGTTTVSRFHGDGELEHFAQLQLHHLHYHLTCSLLCLLNHHYFLEEVKQMVCFRFQNLTLDYHHFLHRLSHHFEQLLILFLVAVHQLFVNLYHHQ